MMQHFLEKKMFMDEIEERARVGVRVGSVEKGKKGCVERKNKACVVIFLIGCSIIITTFFVPHNLVQVHNS